MHGLDRHFKPARPGRLDPDAPPAAPGARRHRRRIALSIKTDGSIMKMPVSQLSGSPFHDYRVPGLILPRLLGVVPLITLIGVWARRAWAWYASFAIGCALVVWILVEITIIDYSILQPVFGSVGALIVVFTLVPQVRRYRGVRSGRA
jgi:hypothetical protein